MVISTSWLETGFTEMTLESKVTDLTTNPHGCCSLALLDGLNAVKWPQCTYLYIYRLGVFTLWGAMSSPVSYDKTTVVLVDVNLKKKSCLFAVSFLFNYHSALFKMRWQTKYDISRLVYSVSFSGHILFISCKIWRANLRYIQILQINGS